MANTTIDFGAGNTTRYYTIPKLNLPNADWCFGFWMRADALPNTAGAQRRTVISTDEIGNGAGDYNITMAKYGDFGGEGSYELALFANDNSGHSVIGFGGSKYYGTLTNIDIFCVLQRRGTNIEGYVVPKGATGVAPDQNAHTLAAITPAVSTTYIGRNTGNFNYVAGAFGELFVLLNDSLTQAQVETLAAGAHITAIKTPAVDLRFRTSNATETNLGSLGAAHNATQFGTGWATATEFFADGASDTTAPALTSGPTTSNSVPTGYRITATSNEAGAAKVVMLAGASQAKPSDATFAASGFGATLTAATPFTVDITGLTGATVYTEWIRIADDASTPNYTYNSRNITTATPVNKGIRLIDIFAPNSTALVANATGVTVVVYDVCGGTELYQGTANIVNGDLDIDNDAVGALAATAFVIVRWTVGADEFVYAGTETVIDLSA